MRGIDGQAEALDAMSLLDYEAEAASIDCNRLTCISPAARTWRPPADTSPDHDPWPSMRVQAGRPQGAEWGQSIYLSLSTSAILHMT